MNFARLFGKKEKPKEPARCPHCNELMNIKSRHHVCKKFAETGNARFPKSSICCHAGHIFVEVGKMERLAHLKAELEYRKMFESEAGESQVFYIFPDSLS
ncbi:MAG: hypothetical protein NTU58_03500 [Candidatus Nealsonbacteria bacterium]|nr:hypothetical protein [Candidatus Nealsonbacteria bacterium]